MVRNMSGKNNPMYGKTHSEKTRKKISDLKKDRIKDGEIPWNLGKKGLPQLKHSEKWKTNHSKKLKGRKRPDQSKRMIENNPFKGKKHTEETKALLRKQKIGTHLTESTKNKIRKKAKSSWKNKNSGHHSEGYLIHLRENALKNKVSKRPEVRKKISETRKRLIKEGKIKSRAGKSIWHNKEHPRGMLGKKHTSDMKKNASKRSKELWKNDDYAKKIFKNLNVKPNKLEISFDILLKENFGNRFEYVGDGKTFINGRNPDFISFKNKEIIELFGSYWHKKEDEQEKKSHFGKYGYKTLVVWDYELKDESKVLNKIKSFIDMGGIEN